MPIPIGLLVYWSQVRGGRGARGARAPGRVHARPDHDQPAVRAAAAPRGGALVRLRRGRARSRGGRGTPTDDSPAHVVEDGKLITGRWPGDAYLFARWFLDKLEEVQRLY